jgi:hypothetical protein
VEAGDGTFSLDMMKWGAVKTSITTCSLWKPRATIPARDARQNGRPPSVLTKTFENLKNVPRTSSRFRNRGGIGSTVSHKPAADRNPSGRSTKKK